MQDSEQKASVESLSSLKFSDALKQYSRSTHDRLDQFVMSMQPFSSVENYHKFLQAQHEFHNTVEPMYKDQKLNQLLPGLSDLARAERVAQDMQYLNVDAANINIPRPQISEDEYLGWVYCAEGSNVGAAILYKEVGKIDIKDETGAAHLAAHPDGRMPHWRNFKAKLDALNLNEKERAAAYKGCDDAFAYFRSLVQAVYS